MVRALATSAAAALLALCLGSAPHARAGSATARLVVSASVVRSVSVSVSAGADARTSGLEVRTTAGAIFSGSLADAARAPGLALSTHPADPRYLVLTVHADAPLAAAAPPRAR